MRIATIVSNSGSGFLCENCGRDGGMAAGLRARGHEVVVGSLYLPPAAEGPDGAGVSPVFYGAVGLYLRHRFPALRRGPRWAGRLLDSPPLLRAAARLSGATDPSGMGALTLSMLRGEEGGQAEDLERLVRWIAGIRPDAVHLSNCLLLGVARRVRKELRIPVACSLQDEHTWIDALGEEEREEAWDVLRERAAEVDLFLPVSGWYARFMGGRLAVPEDRMRVVPVGVDSDAFAAAAHALPFDPPVIGYLSRVSEDMGAGLLTEAFLRLCEGGRFPGLRLRFAGGSTSADAPLLRSMRRGLARRGLLDRVDFLRFFGQPERISFLSSLTVLSVPTVIEEASGSFLLESMAAGVPVVQPRRGGFPELVEATGGGVLYGPNTPKDLADALEGLLRDPRRARALGRSGRKGVEERHCLEASAARYEAAFRSLGGPRAPSRPGLPAAARDGRVAVCSAGSHRS